MKISWTAPATLALFAVTACDSTTPATPKAAGTPSPAVASPVPTGRQGAAGSACELPVSFDLLPGWEADAIDVSRMTRLQRSFMSSGVFDAVCSVSGKPAGEPGFVRVYASDVSTGDRRDDLKAFALMFTIRNGEARDREVRDAKYTDVTIAGQPAAEVSWTSFDTAKNKGSKHTAFTVDTPKGPVVVLEVPWTEAEKGNVRPAYELAKQTLTVA